MQASEIIGQRLRSLRAAVGSSQQELAAQSGVSYRSIQDIEKGSGNPTVQTLEALSDTLGERLAIFDIDNYLEKERHRAEVTALAKDHQAKCDELAAVTRKNFTLQQRYIKALERANEKAAMVESLQAELESLRKKVQSVPSEVFRVFPAMDEDQVTRALTLITSLPGRRSGSNEKKNIRK